MEKKTLWMAAYFFLAMTCVGIVKSMQVALYLGNIGFDWRLPSLYLALAVVSIPLILVFRRLSSRSSLRGTYSAVLLCFAGTAAVFSSMVEEGPASVYLAFFLWGGIFTLLVPSLGWLLSHRLYSKMEAKRQFPVLAAAGLLGGAFGSYYTGLLVPLFSHQWLLFHVCVLLLVLQTILLAVYRSNHQVLPDAERASFSGLEGGTRATALRLFQSRYLSSLACVVLLAAFTSTFIDLQYQWLLEDRYSGQETAITKFFGTLLGTLYILSAVFQLLGTGPLLKRFGVRLGILVLPVALVAGSLGTVVLFGFWSAVLLKLVEGSLRFSLHRTSLELFYIPVPHALAVRSFIDLAVLRLGDSLAAVVYLAAFHLLDLNPYVTGICLLIASGIWVFFAARLGTEYLAGLRLSLEQQKEIDQISPPSLVDGDARGALLEALRSGNSRQILFSLEHLMTAEADSRDQYESLLESSEALMHSGVSGLSRIGVPRWQQEALRLLDHADPRIGAAALAVLTRHQGEKYRRLLSTTFDSEWSPPSLFLHYLENYEEFPARYLSPPRALHWCQSLQVDDLAIMARVMGKTRNPAFVPVLRQWMQEAPSKLGCAAMEGLGWYGDPRHMETLLACLNSPGCRPAARRALVNFGENAIQPLSRLLRDNRADLSIRREIPSLLREIGTSAARSELITGLYTPHPLVSLEVLKNLNKIRAQGDLSYDQATFYPALQVLARDYYRLLNLERHVAESRSGAGKLLIKTVQERLHWTLEKIFRTLELFLPWGDAYYSYLGYTSRRKDMRENAVELIDSRIRGELRPTLLPIFAHESKSEILQAGRQLFDLPRHGDQILRDVLYDGDAWLKCCVLAFIASEQQSSLLESVRRLLEDIDPTVRETADWTLRGMSGSTL